MVNTNTNFDQADDNARQVIRRTKQVTRRRFSPEEKVRIVIEGIRGEITITALCRREGIASNVYYKWLKDPSAGSGHASWRLGRAGLKETPKGRPAGPKSSPCSGRMNG